ncbi:EF-hand domain-containing protein [Plasmodiophora brassicae]|uniref:EF-hand domain-containing protein n=1 Tax=Plasmodiophora brassicae TaxID=37360 RepID=A0A0G4IKS2_PLABS|nr:hypothetical protein PBRA_004400 [Plasmodiophora brassicae]
MASGLGRSRARSVAGLGAPAKVVYERPGLSSEEIEELHEAFNLFDTDGTGEIDPQELKQAMQSLGYDVKNQMVYQVLESLDKDGDKRINFNEFLDMMTARMSSKDSREDIMKVFRLFDDDNKGKISLDNLRRVARELGEDMNEEELKEMITRADLDGDGMINEDEFYNIMTKKTFQ